jgi:Protein of unknown function, DUF481
MKILLLLLISILALAESNVNVGFSNSNDNGSNTKNYSLGGEYDFNISDYTSEITIKRVFSSTDGTATTDYEKIKTLTKYYFNDNNDVYFKLKYYGDKIGTINNQYIEVIGHNYTFKFNKMKLSTKLGAGNIEQDEIRSGLIDSGFIAEYKITDETNIKSDYDYIKFNKGESSDFEIGLYNNLSKTLKLGIVYDNIMNSTNTKSSKYNMTEVKLSYKF